MNADWGASDFKLVPFIELAGSNISNALCLDVRYRGLGGGCLMTIFIGAIMLVSSNHKNANLQRFRLREGTQSHIDDMRGRSIRNFLSFWTKLQALKRVANHAVA